MGFFKRSVPSEKKRTALTIIARNNKISGDLNITGKLHIDGVVEGNITSVDDISIGKTGRILGIVKAKNVTVSGYIEGEIYCQHLHIACEGSVVANVESTELTMDSKSHFTGQCKEIVDTDLNGDKSKAKELKLTLDEKELDDLDASKSSVQNADIIDNLPDKITLGSIDAQAIKSNSNSSRSKTVSNHNCIDKVASPESLLFGGPLAGGSLIDGELLDNKLDLEEATNKALNTSESASVDALSESIESAVQKKTAALGVNNNGRAKATGATIQQGSIKTSIQAKKTALNMTVKKPASVSAQLKEVANELQAASSLKSLLDENEKVGVNDLKNTSKTVEQVKSKIVDKNTTKLELKF
ncbi:MAG: polymer-forming cytoskeletal protein [Oceanospirillaceae bacterium]